MEIKFKVNAMQLVKIQTVLGEMYDEIIARAKHEIESEPEDKYCLDRPDFSIVGIAIKKVKVLREDYPEFLLTIDCSENIFTFKIAKSIYYEGRCEEKYIRFNPKETLDRIFVLMNFLN